MSLFNNIRFFVALYFVERGSVALDGERALEGVVARELQRATSGREVPIVPSWHGSILDDSEAWRRWGIPDVHCVSLGFPSRAQGRAMLAAIRRQPPLGLLDDELDAPVPVTRSLPPGGIIFPGAVLHRYHERAGVDRITGLRTIAFEHEFDAHVFDTAFSWSADDQDAGGFADYMLLGLLARSFGRGYPSVSAASGLPSLVDHAAELLVARAYGAAGAVAGVAFEQLMRRCLNPADRAWAARQKHVKLATIIAKVVKDRGWEERRGRLDAYRRLRNDLAHRLGDSPNATLEDNDALFERVDGLIGWLERQPLTEPADATIELVSVDPDPVISSTDLLTQAYTAGKIAAEKATTTPFSVSGERIDDGLDGAVWVIVPDARRKFTRWLATQDHASQAEGGVHLNSPYRSFERGLAWAHAVSSRLQAASIRCSYVGRIV